MIRKRIAILLIILCTVSLGTGFAQDTIKLSLWQAIELSKQRSLKIQETNHNYDASKYGYLATKALRFPGISMAGNLPGLNRQINTITQPDGSILFVPTSQAISNVSLLISQRIPYLGGNFWIGSNLSRIDLFDTQTYYWNAAPVFFGLSLPLGSFNRDKWDWKSTKLNYKKSHSEFASALEQLSIDITNAYFDYYIATTRYANARFNVDINDSIYRISVGRYNVGKIAENELLQVELSKINAQQSVARLEVEMKIAEQRLKLLVGLKEEELFELDTLPSIKTLTIDMNKAIKEAQDNSTLVIQNQVDLIQSLANMKQASRNRFIDGTLTATFGLNQSGSDLGNVYSNPLNSQTATIGFSIPIYQFGYAQNNYKRNKALYDATLSRTEYLNKSLSIDVQEAVLQYLTYEQAVTSAKMGYEIAIKRYELSKNRFMIGKIDITNLTIAQGEKDEALINYMNTLRNYWVAFFNLRKTTLYDFESNEKLIEIPGK